MEIRKMRIDDYHDIYRLWMFCPGMGLNNLDDSRDGNAFVILQDFTIFFLGYVGLFYFG